MKREKEGEPTSWLKTLLSRGAKDKHWGYAGCPCKASRAMVTGSQERVVGCGGGGGRDHLRWGMRKGGMANSLSSLVSHSW